MDIIALAADHRGYDVKVQLISWLRAAGYMPLDVGTHSADRCDAQDYAVAAARAIKEGKAKAAILICGSGNMICMAANRFPHMRAALCSHALGAKMARLHNDANALCLGADFLGMDMIKDCIEAFLKTEFLGGRYTARVEKLSQINPLL